MDLQKIISTCYWDCAYIYGTKAFGFVILCEGRTPSFCFNAIEQMHSTVRFALLSSLCWFNLSPLISSLYFALKTPKFVSICYFISIYWPYNLNVNF